MIGPYHAVMLGALRLSRWLSWNTVARPRPARSRPSWQLELDRMSWRYHVIGSWAAALINILFILNDRSVVPLQWERFAIVRTSVTVGIVLALLLRDRSRLGPHAFLFIPYALISSENAYMWSFLEGDAFALQALAYAVLFLGASMIVLWPVRWSIAIMFLTVLLNVWLMRNHCTLAPSAVFANGGAMLGAVMVIATLMGHNRYRLARREVRLRAELKASTDEARNQRAVIEEAHRDLTDSIRYSQRIQQAVLPKADVLREHLPEHFVIHRPKDIVSGDLLWCAHVDGRTVVAAVDCTGHGVPGALMSILGNSLLSAVVHDERDLAPAHILDELRGRMITALGAHGEGALRDGMDIALCTVDRSARMLRFAGANNPLYRVRGNELFEIPGDRMPIGEALGTLRPFTEHAIPIEEGDVFYLCSDGFQDQFGGPDYRRFGRVRLKRAFTRVAPLPMAEQQRVLHQELKLWQQHRPAIDDVLVVGFRV